MMIPAGRGIPITITSDMRRAQLSREWHAQNTQINESIDVLIEDRRIEAESLIENFPTSEENNAIREENIEFIENNLTNQIIGIEEDTEVAEAILNMERVLNNRGMLYDAYNYITNRHVPTVILGGIIAAGSAYITYRLIRNNTIPASGAVVVIVPRMTLFGRILKAIMYKE